MFNYLCRTAMLVAVMWASAPTALLAQTTSSATQSLDGEVLRDPTRPFAALSGRTSSTGFVEGDSLLPDAGLTRRNFNVTFIRDGGASPMAVINGQQVMPGDSIDGATVTAITSAGVTLSVNGLDQVINTFGPTVKEVSGTEF